MGREQEVLTKKVDHRMFEPFLNYFSGFKNLHTIRIQRIISLFHKSDINIFFLNLFFKKEIED